TAIESNRSRSTSARTAATEARDTCAVPSSTYSTPLRVTRASGCSCSGSSDESGCAFNESIPEALQQIAVRIDTPVAQEWPDAAHVLAARHVDFSDKQFAAVVVGLRQHLALWAGDETGAPELDAAAAVGRRFEARAVASCQRQAVGDRVPALHGDPGIALAVLLGLRIGRIPTDSGWVQQDFGSGQRHQSRRFGIPLVPAHQYAELAERSLYGIESEIARREVELLIIRRIVRDVHLAIDARDLGRAIEDGRGVVIQPGRAALEDRCDDHQLQLFREPADARARFARDRFGAVELAHVLVLAEVRTVVQLLQKHQLRTGGFCLAQAGFDRVEVQR